MNTLAPATLDPLAQIIIFHPEVLGRFRRELVWTLGEERAHGFMARVGVSCGLFEHIDNAPVPHLFEGMGTIQSAAMGNGGPMAFDVRNSQEALEHRRFFRPTLRTQCWLLAGYLTGWISQQKDEPVYFLETTCIAKGDSACRFVGQPYQAWGPEKQAELRLFEEDNVAFDLASVQEQLHLTKDRYQNLFEQSSLAIFIIDPKSGAHLNVNHAAAEMSGYPYEQILGMTIFDLCHPQEHHRLMNDMKMLMNGGKLADREFSLVRKDGLIRVVTHSSKILTYGGQRVIQTVLRDITDLKISTQKEKDLQNQLVRSERLSSIGRLAASVAHELKNPLGAIRNAVYYVKNALASNPVLESDPHLKMVLKLVEEEVDASVMIIGELLDFSRVVQLAPRKIQLNEVLEKLPAMVAVPENIELKWDLDITLPAAIVDPDRLTQVFSNLLVNAVQAMPNGGTLTIGTNLMVETAGDGGVNQEFILITLEDTGHGIEPVHMSKIFEPLFTTKARGTGLGLAISRNIVEKHGGQILVTSQVGKGTRFTIKLPLHAPVEKEDSSHEHG